MAGKAVTTKKLVIFALGTGLTSILSKLCLRKFENSIPKILENFNKQFNKQHEDGDDEHKNPHTAKFISSTTRGTTVGRRGQCGEDYNISCQ